MELGRARRGSSWWVCNCPKSWKPQWPLSECFSSRCPAYHDCRPSSLCRLTVLSARSNVRRYKQQQPPLTPSSAGWVFRVLACWQARSLGDTSRSAATAASCRPRMLQTAPYRWTTQAAAMISEHIPVKTASAPELFGCPAKRSQPSRLSW